MTKMYHKYNIFFLSSVEQTMLSSSELRQSIMLGRMLERISEDLRSHIEIFPDNRHGVCLYSQFPILNRELYFSTPQDCCKSATIWSIGVASLRLPVQGCIRDTLAGGHLERG